MAKITLEIVADSSQADSSLQKMANGFTKVNAESKKFKEDTKKGFEEVASTAKKANEEIASPKVTENQKKSLSAIQQLKNEIKAYEAAALKAGEGTAAFAKNIALAGQKKAELKDLKEAVAALDPDAVAKGFLGLASSMAGGFAVAQGAIALTGQKSEDLEKALLKVQAAQAILSGLQALANFQDEAAKVKIIFLNKLATLEARAQAAATELQVAATGEQIVATEVQTAATVQLTVAQRIFNLVAMANPFALIVAGVAALAIAVGVLIDKYAKQKTEAEKLEEAYQNLKKANVAIIEGIDNEITALEGLKANEEKILALKQERAKLTLEENRLAVEAATKSAEAIANQAKEQNNLNVFQKAFQTIVFGAGNADIAVKEKQKKALDTLTERTKEFSKTIAENSKADNEAQQKKLDAQKEANQKYLDAQKEFNSALEDLRKKSIQAEIDQLTGVEKVQAIEKQQLDELAAYEKGLRKKGKLTAEQENQLIIIRNNILLKSGQEQLDIEKDNAEKLLAEQKRTADELAALRTSEFNADLKIIEDNQKVLILKTQEGTAARIQAEIDAEIAIANFKKTQVGLTGAEVEIIERESLEKIVALRKELASKNEFSWAKLLGVSEEELGKIKQSLNQVLNETKKIIDQQLQAEQDALDERKRINDEVISNADERIKTLQDQLDTELALNEQGFANNVDLVRSQIELANQERQKGLEEEKRIADEQVKLKKKQAIADSVAQASSLLSAGATLFAQGALKGPAGIITAVATIAGMLASFLALKSKLSEAGFKEGGYTGDGGESDVAGAVHGREFVSTAKTTKKHRNLLEAMHNNDYSGLTVGDLSPILQGVKFNADALTQIDTEQTTHATNKAQYNNAMLSVMASTNKQLSKFFNHVKNKPTEGRNSKGDIIIKKGNTTRIIKAKK